MLRSWCVPGLQLDGLAMSAERVAVVVAGRKLQGWQRSEVAGSVDAHVRGTPGATPPVPVTGMAGTCRNVLPERCDSVRLNVFQTLAATVNRCQPLCQ